MPIEIAGEQCTVEAAVMDNLQSNALFGMDIPDLFVSLQKKASGSVMPASRAQLRRERQMLRVLLL